MLALFEDGESLLDHLEARSRLQQTLVDYEYDSDEENDENSGAERLNKDEDEENIEPSAKRLAMSNSPVTAAESSIVDNCSGGKSFYFDPVKLADLFNLELFRQQMSKRIASTWSWPIRTSSPSRAVVIASSKSRVTSGKSWTWARTTRTK